MMHDNRDGKNGIVEQDREHGIAFLMEATTIQRVQSHG